MTSVDFSILTGPGWRLCVRVFHGFLFMRFDPTVVSLDVILHHVLTPPPLGLLLPILLAVQSHLLQSRDQVNAPSLGEAARGTHSSRRIPYLGDGASNLKVLLGRLLIFFLGSRQNHFFRMQVQNGVLAYARSDVGDQ